MEQVVSFLFKYRAALFSKSQFGFGARPSLLMIIALVAGLALLAYYLYLTPKVRLATKWRAALIALRVGLFAIILFCIMRPIIVVPSIIPQSTYVAVMMDDSSSMMFADANGGARLETVKQLMTPDRPFYKELLEKFKVRAFKFASSPERVRDATELAGAGPQTNLDAALEQAARDSSGLPYSGIVLITDGASNGDASNADGLANTLADLRARGLPVYVIGVGPTSLENDVEIARATAPRRVVAGAPVTAEILVSAGGSARSVHVDLTEDNHPLRSQEVPVQANGTTVARISFTPSSPGIHRYTVTAQAPEGDPIPENNSQELLIEVEDARPKILYIEGEPRWEYGKLREALAEEKRITLVSVLRSADGKFYRQGIENANELTAGFPRSEEELFKYDAVIIGSIEATFFTFDQLKAIEQFVSRRGGTLVMLGGSKAFNAGGYANTPLADLLPVYLRGEVAAAGENQSFKAAPAERGRDHPAARLADDAEASARAWEHMPAITLPEIITEIKPGATVVLEARSAKGGNRVVPLLIEERYGRGRTLAMMASDTWRWRMMLESKDKSFETFWRNLLRYTVDSVRHTTEVSTEQSSYSPGETVRIRAEVVDERFISINDAQVTAHITTPSGNTVDLPMKLATEATGDGYTVQFTPDEDGVHRIEVTAQRGGNQSALQSGSASFLVGPMNREAHEAAQNRELLKRIAAETGGGYYTPDQAENLIEDITHTEGPGTVREAKDLWDMPINFMLIIGLAGGEWFIRKRKGLA
ncbi:MAG TPA: glutamine amidotransferase [Blastocatellia bacterium]|nr:glutamine amidotransferase [Blastocatellia bacterium]